MAKNKKFRLVDAILSVITVVFVAEAAAPAAAPNPAQSVAVVRMPLGRRLNRTTSAMTAADMQSAILTCFFIKNPKTIRIFGISSCITIKDIQIFILKMLNNGLINLVKLLSRNRLIHFSPSNSIMDCRCIHNIFVFRGTSCSFTCMYT